MKKTIAVEDSLRNVKQALEEEGYRLVGMSDRELQEAEAVVVTGMDVDMMQMDDLVVEVPVFSAHGRSADEIVEEINNLLD